MAGINELAVEVQKEMGCSHRAAERAVKAVLNCIVAQTSLTDREGKPVRMELRGFGSFVRKARSARKYYNPHAGKLIDKDAFSVLTFRASGAQKK